MPRYLTKSRFKLACECPTKLFYIGKEQYADQKIDDPFLLELAKGGFQVGELAKCYFPEGVEVDASRGDHEAALRATSELLSARNVTIFEAAIRYANYFIRIDVLVKRVDHLEVIEVKSKSYAEGDEFFGRGGIKAKWKPYLYDIAFQKFVVVNAFPDLSVSAYLMLVDKDSHCPTDGLNQKLRVKTGRDGQKYVEVASPLTPEEISPAGWILKKLAVDDACERIFAGTDIGVAPAKSFAEHAAEYADFYARDQRLVAPISGACKTCEFKATAEEKAEGRLSGFDECLALNLGWRAEELEQQPTIFELWKLHHVHRDRLIGDGRVKMVEITREDISFKKTLEPGMTQSERQWLQIETTINQSDEVFIDAKGLLAVMAEWTFPLHFIDFETATPAIPFNKGRRPYEGIAFQFSHHMVHEDGRVEHAGQYLNRVIGIFPNYEFARRLKEQLSNDEGTIFHYAAHENTYLNLIYRQLTADRDEIADREELKAFIRSISKSGRDNAEQWQGERSMIDLLDLVLKYYFDPLTRGSNSIKAVLPAILNRSRFIQDTYSKPIYGNEIRSLNFQEGKALVEMENGRAKDPYSLLPKMFGSDFIDGLSDEDELKDGGAAMMAYARLRFEDMSEKERSDIESALLRYCELDTLAMVMIYQAWRNMLS